MVHVKERPNDIFEDSDFLRKINILKPEGNGTSCNPYRIASFKNLFWLSRNSSAWSSYFIQTADIDAKKTYTESSVFTWQPIGSMDIPFKGSYNGNGYTISNLFLLNRRDKPDNGFFGVLHLAEVNNLRLDGVCIKGYRYVGGVCGELIDSSVSGCSVRGVISGISHVGGITGIVIRKRSKNTLVSNFYKVKGKALESVTKTKAVTKNPMLGVVSKVFENSEEKPPEPWYFLKNYDPDIQNCKSNCKIMGKFIAGGITGVNINGTLLRNTTMGVVVSFMHGAGGIAAINASDSVIYSCFSYSDIEGFDSFDAGGLVSVNSGFIISCCSTGDVHSIRFSGGLVAANLRTGAIYNSYSRGLVFDKIRDRYSYEEGDYIQICYKDPGDEKMKSKLLVNTVPKEGYDLPYHYSHSGGLIAHNKGLVANSFWERIDECEAVKKSYAEWVFFKQHHFSNTMNKTGYVYSSKGGNGIKAQEMGNQRNFPGWDFTNVWTIGEVPGLKYKCPVLKQNPSYDECRYSENYRKFL